MVDRDLDLNPLREAIAQAILLGLVVVPAASGNHQNLQGFRSRVDRGDARGPMVAAIQERGYAEREQRYEGSHGKEESL